MEVTQVADSSSFFGDEPADDQEYDGYGRYKLDVDGTGTKSYTRSTTLAKTLDSGDGLAVWKARNLAYGVAQRPDLVARASLTPVSDKKSWREIEGQAEIVAAAGARANLGTAFHQLHERASELTDEEYAAVDPNLRVTYERYRAELDRLGITEILTEVTVANTAIGTAGKVDGYARLSDGRVVVLDRKSGRVTEYPHSPACQLAIYSHADRLKVDDGWLDVSRALPDLDTEVGLIVDVQIGDADTASVHVYEIDLSAGWYGALLATKVRRWRNRKDLLTPYQPEFSGARIKLPMEKIAQYIPISAEMFTDTHPTIVAQSINDTRVPTVAETEAALNAAIIPAANVHHTLPGGQWGFNAAQVEAGEHEQLAEKIRAQAAASLPVAPTMQATVAAVNAAVADISPAAAQASAQFIGEQAAAIQAAAMAELDAEEVSGAGVPFPGEPAQEDPSGLGVPELQASDAEALLAGYKTKAELQSVVRKLNGPNANVARTRANLAADAVASVNWPQYRAEILAGAKPAKAKDTPVVTAQTNVTGQAVTAAALALPREGVQMPDNPFAQPEPPAPVEHATPPVSPEETILATIGAAASIQDLARCWQAAKDGGIEWSARLQTAATIRQKTFA